MGRIRTYFGAVIVAAILLGGAGPQQKPEVPSLATQQAQPAQPLPPVAAVTAPQYTPEPDRNADGCYNARDHDAADLCAQWRAAIAAEKALLPLLSLIGFPASVRFSLL